MIVIWNFSSRFLFLTIRLSFFSPSLEWRSSSTNNTENREVWYLAVLWEDGLQWRSNISRNFDHSAPNILHQPWLSAKGRMISVQTLKSDVLHKVASNFSFHFFFFFVKEHWEIWFIIFTCTSPWSLSLPGLTTGFSGPTPLRLHDDLHNKNCHLLDINTFCFTRSGLRPPRAHKTRSISAPGKHRVALSTWCFV